ncbi:MAG: hypothetical protein ABR548_14485 [Actinomycetota bacterium]
MKILSFFIPGDYEDVYLYMDHLLLLERDGQLVLVPLGGIVDQVSEVSDDLASVAQGLLRRNDIFTTTRESSVSLAALSGLSRLPSSTIEIRPKNLELVDTAIIGPPGRLLALAVYYRRAYFGTTKGVFDVDLDFDDLRSNHGRGVRPRIDGRCVALSARLGAISVSLGKQGLYSSFGEFGSESASSEELEFVTQPSARTGWLGDDLINYGSRVELSLFRSALEEVHRPSIEEVEDEFGGRPTTKRLVGFSEDGISDRDLASSAGDRFQVSYEDIQFVWNSRRYFFIRTYAGSIFSLRPRQHGRTVEDFAVSPRPRLESRVVSAHVTANGLVLETDDRVVLYSERAFHTLYEGEVATIKSFPRSVRYRHIVAATVDDGVLIQCALDESRFRLIADWRNLLY